MDPQVLDGSPLPSGRLLRQDHRQMSETTDTAAAATVNAYQCAGADDDARTQGTVNADDTVTIGLLDKVFRVRKQVLMESPTLLREKLMEKENEKPTHLHFDRTSTHFHDILIYLCYKKIQLPDDEDQLIQFKEEAVFFEIKELVEMIDQKMAHPRIRILGTTTDLVSVLMRSEKIVCVFRLPHDRHWDNFPRLEIEKFSIQFRKVLDVFIMTEAPTSIVTTTTLKLIHSKSSESLLFSDDEQSVQLLIQKAKHYLHGLERKQPANDGALE